MVEITEIEERKYAEPGQVSSDLAAIAAADALTSSGIDKESLDYIIVARIEASLCYMRFPLGAWGIKV